MSHPYPPQPEPGQPGGEGGVPSPQPEPQPEPQPGAQHVPPAPQAPGPQAPGPAPMPSMPAPMPSMPAPMPQAPPPGAPAGPVSRPSSVVQAVRLMWAGAVLSVLSGLLTPLIRDDLRSAMEKSMAGQPTPLTGEQLDTIVTVIVVVSVIFGVLWAGVWVLMAWANGRGKSWARIVATILFALNVLSFVASLAQGQSTGPVLVVGLLTLLVGAAVVALLWKRETTAYIEAQSAPRW